MKKSTVFDETYNKYLSHISDIDFLSRAVILGAELAEDSLIIIDMKSLAIGATYLTSMLTKT